jgi:hypothetical protein
MWRGHPPAKPHPAGLQRRLTRRLQFKTAFAENAQFHPIVLTTDFATLNTLVPLLVNADLGRVRGWSTPSKTTCRTRLQMLAVCDT